MEEDFLFNIMAYNKKHRSFQSNLKSTPYLFKVKMRMISEFDEEKINLIHHQFYF